MIVEIPFTNDAYQDLTISWQSLSLKFTMYWNDQASNWYFDILETISNTMYANGIALVLGADMLEPLALNIGGLFASSDGSTNENPTLEGLGTTYKVYLTDEL